MTTIDDLMLLALLYGAAQWQELRAALETFAAEQREAGAQAEREQLYSSLRESFAAEMMASIMSTQNHSIAVLYDTMKDGPSYFMMAADVAVNMADVLIDRLGRSKQNDDLRHPQEHPPQGG